MPEISLVAVPAILGILCFAIGRTRTISSFFLLLSGISHLALSAYFCFFAAQALPASWIGIDPLNSVFLLLTSFIFLVSSAYLAAIFFNTDEYDWREACKTSACLQFFLSAMTLVILSRHLGFMWVGMEATTLATAPLIYLHRNRNSLEASWKYLIICSVGIGLSLIGNIFIVAAFSGAGELKDYLLLHNLKSSEVIVNSGLMKIAFIFFIVGYGTKMGLAPLHTWLPDAHSESPAFVSAMLSGALLNCAFLALIRISEICEVTGIGSFSGGLLVLFGLLSVLAAGIFIIKQTDIKRMLAYSSVENMGILAFGLGIGGVAGCGAILHMVNHSLAKAMLFLTAGIIYFKFKTREVSGISGILKEIPFAGLLWLAGGLALCGMPPFGLFISKFIIIKGAFDSGNTIQTILLLAFVAVAVIGLTDIFIKTSYGGKVFRTKAGIATDKGYSESAKMRFICKLLAIFPFLPGICSIALCFYIPPFIADAMKFLSFHTGGFLP